MLPAESPSPPSLSASLTSAKPCRYATASPHPQPHAFPPGHRNSKPIPALAPVCGSLLVNQSAGSGVHSTAPASRIWLAGSDAPSGSGLDSGLLSCLSCLFLRALAPPVIDRVVCRTEPPASCSTILRHIPRPPRPPHCRLWLFLSLRETRQLIMVAWVVSSMTSTDLDCITTDTYFRHNPTTTAIPQLPWLSHPTSTASALQIKGSLHVSPN